MKNARSAWMSDSLCPRAVAVRRKGAGWVVAAMDCEVSGRFTTKAGAVAAAKQMLARRGGVLTVHDAGGRVRETLTLGRDTAVRLNGIEGVAMNASTRRLVRTVQASGLTPAQQMKAVVAAFKK